MQTKSIRLTEEEAAELREYLAITGEVEAAVLKRAALRGLKELRVDQAILAYLEARDSTRAAAIAGLPRAAFLQVLVDKGIALLEGPSTLAEELETLAKSLSSDKLALAARKLAEQRAHD